MSGQRGGECFLECYCSLWKQPSLALRSHYKPSSLFLIPKLPFLFLHVLFLVHFLRKYVDPKMSLQKCKWLSLAHQKQSYSILSRPVQTKYFPMAFKSQGNSKNLFILFWKQKLKCTTRARLRNRFQRTYISGHHAKSSSPASAGSTSWEWLGQGNLLQAFFRSRHKGIGDRKCPNA